MAAVEPDFTPRRTAIRERTGTKPLHPRRPFRVHDTRLEGLRLDFESFNGAQRRDGKAGIVELMAAEKPRRRQIHQATIVLIDQTPALDIDVPFLPGNVKRRA